VYGDLLSTSSADKSKFIFVTKCTETDPSYGKLSKEYSLCAYSSS